MKVVIRLNYPDLAHLAPLFQELSERFPGGWIHFGSDDQDETCTLAVQPYHITPEDRQFFDTLRANHLVSSWFHDPFE